MCLICNVSRRGFFKYSFGAAAGLAALPRRALATPRSRPRIVLDPGHGGKDPGTIAPDGYYEKTIALATGLELYHALRDSGRYDVHMTRATDTFITLDDRVKIAQDYKADLFMSMHCDHLPEANIRGASIFTLSNKASDKLSAGLAQEENSVDLSAGAPHGTSPQVADILASLETRATKLNSATFQSDLHNALQRSVPMLPNPERSANFAVLRDPSVPSVLLEMGCLSDKQDEQRLRNLAKRQVLVAQLRSAIESYFSSGSSYPT